jgi:hypothetical protein
MTTKEKLYQAIQGSSLSDYALFNRDHKDQKKNQFLSLVTKALNRSEWFEISKFKYLGEKPFKKEITYVPLADEDVKNEEYSTLEKIFSKNEIVELIQIIENMKSYGVSAIKELMDEEEKPKKRWMRSAFLSPLFLKK